MVDHAVAVEATGDTPTLASSLGRLLSRPLPAPRIRVRPWWFPAQELSDPLVFYLEVWLADSIFGEPPVHGCIWVSSLQLGKAQLSNSTTSRPYLQATCVAGDVQPPALPFPGQYSPQAQHLLT
jgi:hypothetical protein